MALGLKVTIAATLAWFIVGVLAFSSLQEFKNKKMTTMVNKTAKMVLGVALVGRMVLTSNCEDLTIVADVT